MFDLTELENLRLSVATTRAVGAVERLHAAALGLGGPQLTMAENASLGPSTYYDEDDETVEIFRAGMVVGGAPVVSE